MFSIGKNKQLQNLIFKLGNFDVLAKHSIRAYINESYKEYCKSV